MTEEVKLLEHLGMKPDYDKIWDELTLQRTVDQTSSGRLTPEAVDRAMDKAGEKVKHLVIPPRQQGKIRRDVLFVEYEEERLRKGVIGRYMGMTVEVDEDLQNRDNMAAFILTGNPETAAAVRLS